MRILLLSDWTANPGGSERYAVALAPLLRAEGHDVRFVACGADVPGDAGADVRAFGSTARAAQSVLQIANLPAAVRVRRAIRSWRPDVAIVVQFAYHLSPAVFGAIAGVPAITLAMDYKFVCPLGTKLLPDGSICTRPHGIACWSGGCVSALHWLRDRPRYFAIAASLRRATRIVVCSRRVQHVLAQDGIRSDCVPLPVWPASASYRRAPAATPLFAYAGRLAPEKGVDVLLRAFIGVVRDQPAAALRVIGDGPERASLERLTATLGLGHAVTFAGAMTPPGVERELSAAWALVAPSRWAEPFGLVAVEAIARGVPVVATAEGGFAETVEDGVSGQLVPNGDADALGGALAAIARRESFPSLIVPDGARRALLERHDPRRHVAALLART